MQGTTVRYNEQDKPEFHKELRKRVNQYFKEKGISKHANANMLLKTLFMITLYTTPLLLMLTGIVTSAWGVIGMWTIMGFGMSGIGLSIMHDANHGAYSSKKWVNRLFGSILNYIGGYHVNWKIQHNVLHHTFTNIDGMDEDIEKQGIVRFSPTQEHRRGFKFQILYAPFLYMILTAYWVTFKDFEQLFNYSKRDLLKSQGVSFTTALFSILIHKTWYYGLKIVLPILLVPVPWWVIVIGFFVMQAISGLILALIFQAAHVVGETEFFEVGENGEMENSWAVHQMKTTANFANGSRVFSWLIGGLNYQIEHHLFPHICHVHYRHLSKIVKETANEYDVPYNTHKTFFGALRSHFGLIHVLGMGRV